MPAVLGLALGACAGTPPPSETGGAAELNLKLGVGYMQAGYFDVALEKLQKALDYGPDLAEAHNAIAVLYEETGDDELAEHHYRRAIELDPAYVLARMNYGRYLCSHGRPQAGEAQFLDAASDAEPDVRDRLYAGAGSCARRVPAPSRAEEHLRRALEVNPRHAPALLELADLSHETGRDLQARAFLQRFHARAGYSAQSLHLGIRIEEALGGSQLRQDYTARLLTQFGDSREARSLSSSE